MKIEEVKLTKTQQKAVDAGEAAPPGFGKTQYLVFWSNRQLDRLAELALASEAKPTKAAAKAAADADHGLEVALFGRMVATPPISMWMPPCRWHTPSHTCRHARTGLLHRGR